MKTTTIKKLYLTGWLEGVEAVDSFQSELPPWQVVGETYTSFNGARYKILEITWE